MGNLKTGFVHTVFFWLKEKNNKAHNDQLHAGLVELSKIAEIGTAYIGQPAPTDRDVIDNSYDFSITFVFETAENQDIYQVHPDHLAFIANCSMLWDKVQVYDAC